MEHQIKSLLNFLDSSPCNFYAVHTVREILINNGFAEKSLEDALTAQPGEKFFVTKNHSAIFAFTVGKKPVADTGLKIIAAHSDSPCFRVKPHAEMLCEGGIVKLNTEVYGGPILYPWFDRPLSLAGRVLLKGNDALHPITRLVKIDRPLFSIWRFPVPFSLAI